MRQCGNIVARPPVAVGGLGGSGTRVVAAILAAAGIRMGPDLNQSLDNLWFTLLFKATDVPDYPHDRFDAIVSAFCGAMSGQGELSAYQRSQVMAAGAHLGKRHGSEWLQRRRQSFIGAFDSPRSVRPLWGWKEPTTHMLLPRLNQAIPGLRYIHVVRHGLDMAYSRNQNQMRLWGRRLLSGDMSHAEPRLSLAFWVASHRRILEIGNAMGSRFLLVDYDRLCSDPEREVDSLFSFLGVEPEETMLAEAYRLIHSSPNAGRFRAHSEGHFDPGDLAYLDNLGYSTA